MNAHFANNNFILDMLAKFMSKEYPEFVSVPAMYYIRVAINPGVHGLAMIGEALKCAFCKRTFHDFGGLGIHVRREHPEIRRALAPILSALPASSKTRKGRSTMGKSISDMRQERGGGGPPMLHGSDLLKSESSVKIKVKELREAPKNFNSPAILDLAEPVHEKEAFAVNITNLRALAALQGMDSDTADFDKLANVLKGKTLTLYKTVVNNPKTKKMTTSLFFEPPE